jgi:hypothetical protein
MRYEDRSTWRVSNINSQFRFSMNIAQATIGGTGIGREAVTGIS